MFKLPVRTWIFNAAAVFSGRHVAVTRQAEQAGCSRQTIYQHAHKLEQRLGDEPAADPITGLLRGVARGCALDVGECASYHSIASTWSVGCLDGLQAYYQIWQLEQRRIGPWEGPQPDTQRGVQPMSL